MREKEIIIYIYCRRFPNSSGISLTSWMLYSVPPMLLMGFLTWVWLQVLYMGMFRSESKDAQAINIGTQGEKVAASVIEKKYKELGSITWHESSVGVLFITVVLLWFFRSPGFVRGWPTYITSLYVSFFYFFVTFICTPLSFLPFLFHYIFYFYLLSSLSSHFCGVLLQNSDLFQQYMRDKCSSLQTR